MKAIFRTILPRAVAFARVEASFIRYSQQYPCYRLLFHRPFSTPPSPPSFSHNTSPQDLQLKLLREV
jgi:hypothetical protein